MTLNEVASKCPARKNIHSPWGPGLKPLFQLELQPGDLVMLYVHLTPILAVFISDDTKIIYGQRVGHYTFVTGDEHWAAADIALYGKVIRRITDCEG